MEDILDLYHQPYDPKRPLVGMDETSKQLIRETRSRIQAHRGRVERYDYEYERNGVSNLFMLFEPLGGWRHVKVTDRRTKIDWAQCMQESPKIFTCRALTPSWGMARVGCFWL